MTRAKLEALVEDLISRTIPPCQTALKDAGLSAGEIDEIVLVGGMTRIPKVIQEVKTLGKTLISPLIQTKWLLWAQQYKLVFYKVT